MTKLVFDKIVLVHNALFSQFSQCLRLSRVQMVALYTNFAQHIALFWLFLSKQLFLCQANNHIWTSNTDNVNIYQQLSPLDT